MSILSLSTWAWVHLWRLHMEKKRINTREYFKAEKREKSIPCAHSQWNYLKCFKKKERKKETSGVLTTRDRTGQPKQITAVNDRNIVKAMKNEGAKNPRFRYHNPVFEKYFESRNLRFISQTKPLISSKNQRARLELAKKYRNEPQHFWNQDWPQQNDGKAKVWRKKRSAHDPKHTITNIRHRRKYHDLDCFWNMHSCFWKGLFLDDLRFDGRNFVTHTANTTMNFINRKSEMFKTGQVN